MNGDDTREWELSSAGRRQVREQRAKREAELETKIAGQTNEVERLRQARDRAVVKLCATQRWLEDVERELAEQVEELETLRGGE